MRHITRRGRLVILAPLAALVLFLAPPAPRHAAASACEENSGPLCSKNTSCVWILFFKQCTEEYNYYPD